MKSKPITPRLRPALEAQLAGHDSAGLMAAAYQHQRHTLGLPAKLIKQVMEGNIRPEYTYHTTQQNLAASFRCTGSPGEHARFIHEQVVRDMSRKISEGDMYSYSDGPYEGYRPVVMQLGRTKGGACRGHIAGYYLSDNKGEWLQGGAVFRNHIFYDNSDAMNHARNMADTAALEEADYQEAYQKGQEYAETVDNLVSCMNAARAANEPNVSSMLKAMSVSALDSAVLAAEIASSRCSEFEPFTPAHERADARVGAFAEGYNSMSETANLMPDMITVVEKTCSDLRDYIEANT